MKKILLTIGVVAVVVAAAIGGAADYFGNANRPAAPIVAAAPDYKNISYLIDGKEVKLENGAAETTVDGATTATKYFGNEARGDFDGNGSTDIAFILTQDNGGSGTFFYAVAALKTENGYVGTNAVLLGDRIAPQSTDFSNGVITVNYADRASGEPMTAAPSVGVSLRLKVAGGELVKITP
jgi:hypothetical protein